MIATADKTYSGSDEFVHLHAHTIFSSLDGVARPEQYFQACVDRKWPAVAITEHGVLSSIPDAFWASQEYGIKFIAGCEIYYNDYELKRQELSAKKVKMGEIKQDNPELETRIRRNRHLTVLAKNEEGYRNLLRLNTYAWQNGFYYKPRIWFDQLAKHKEGLIVLSGCLNGPLSHELRRGNFKTKNGITGAIDYFNKFNDVFGDDYYIEIQMPCITDEATGWKDIEVFNKLVAMAQHKKKKLVVTNDSHYMNRADFQVQKVMMAIDQGLTVDDPELFHVNSDEQFYKTRDDLRETFNKQYSDKVDNSTFEKACDNTLEIADKCNTFTFDLETKLPTVDDADKKLATQSLEGLKWRGLHGDKTKYEIDGNEVTAYDQMFIELKRISEKGFSSYFVITKNIVDHARKIYGPNSVGPARGSAGGSLICYILGITDINPLKWKLSFDRMLSPARGGMMLKVSME